MLEGIDAADRELLIELAIVAGRLADGTVGPWVDAKEDDAAAAARWSSPRPD